MLFVSHNHGRDRVALRPGDLARAGPGRPRRAGPRTSSPTTSAPRVPDAIEGTPLADRTDRTGDGRVRLVSFRLEDHAGHAVTHVASGRDVTFVLGFEADGPDGLEGVDVGISVHSQFDTTLFVIYQSYTGDLLRVDRGRGEFRCTIPRLPLSPGRYQVGARVTVGGDEADWPRDGVGSFHVEAGDFYGSGRKGCEGATAFLVDGRWAVR